MKKSRLVFPVVLGTLVIAAAGAWFFLTQRPTGSTAQPAPEPAVSVVDGLTIVKLDPAVQRRGGIVAEPVVASQGGSETTSYGTVMDLQPLTDWRARLLAAASQAQAAHAQSSAAVADLRRTQALYEDDRNASRKALDAAQALGQRERAAADTADSALAALRDQGTQQFGPVLDRWAAASSHGIQRLLERRDSIVAVAPTGAGEAPRDIDIALAGGPRIHATWVSAAAHADPRLGIGLQLYRVAAPLPANASVVAFLPSASSARGAFVPLAAVVWFADQPWAYLQRDASHFARVPLRGATETDKGFIVPREITPGQQVVTQGAGLLLSQEQLPPPGAAACKDPECD